jgi:hypothetical protein
MHARSASCGDTVKRMVHGPRVAEEDNIGESVVMEKVLVEIAEILASPAERHGRPRPIERIPRTKIDAQGFRALIAQVSSERVEKRRGQTLQKKEASFAVVNGVLVFSRPHLN